MEVLIINECKDLIERRIQKLYLNKGKEIEWDAVRTLNCSNEYDLKNRITNLIDEGDLSEGTTVETYQRACDIIKQLEEDTQHCIEAEGSSIVHDENVDNNSSTSTDKKSAWVLYKNRLINEKNFSNLSVNIIEKDTEKIRKRLSTEYNSETKAIKGMVVGAVQSGKTANMGALISQCADNGWNCFIILGGMIENLRSQTEKRMIDDFSNKGRYKWTSLSSICNSTEDPSHNLSMLNLSKNSTDKYLCIALKQKDRLNNLIKWLKKDKENALNLKVLIIDDEADQASVNTGDITAGEKKTIYALIDKLVNGVDTENGKKQLCGAMNYICYTATPYANFLNDSDAESLYPRNFIATLTEPKSYIGPQEIFGLEKDNYDGLSIIREIGENDNRIVKEIYNGASEVMPKSLEESLIWFLCVVSVMRLKQRKVPYSMLINVSQKIDDHELVSNVIEKWFSSMSKEKIITLSKKIWEREVENFSLDIFKEELPSYENIDLVEDYPKFNEFFPYLEKIIDYGINPIVFNDEKNEFDYNNGIHLCVDNSKNNKLNENSEYRRLIYPSKRQLTTLQAPAFIVIGGNTLSRGLTIEGLVSTFFLRTGRQVDSLMQMGRWFGYRLGYELYQRIWMSKNTESQFNFISQLDYDLRMNLNQYMTLNVSPSEVGPLINNTPAVSWLRITAKNKQQSVINATYDYTGIQAQTISFDEELDIMRHNIEQTREFLNTLEIKPKHSRTNTSYVWKNVDVEDVLEYLNSFKFCHNNRLFNDLVVFSKWLKTNKQEGTVSKWNIVLCGINEGIEWKLNDNISIKKVTRSRKIKITDYINIGVLRAYKDNFEDIEYGELACKQKEIEEKIKSPRENDKKRNFFDFKKEIGFNIKPMLVLYVIDGNPLIKIKSKVRKSLDLQEDIVGIYLSVPGKRKNNDSVSQITVGLSGNGGVYYDED